MRRPDPDLDQPALFDRPPGAPPPKLRKAIPPDTARYQRFSPRYRTLCDDCTRDIDRRGVTMAPLPTGAAWKRITSDGTEVLCDRHRRERQGVA